MTAGLGGTRPLEMTLAQNSRGLVPWAGIAARICTDQIQQEPSGMAPGRAFCFLPLPVAVGMPVHVNGYFELSSNRRCGFPLSGSLAMRQRSLCFTISPLTGTRPCNQTACHQCCKSSLACEHGIS